MAAAPVSGLEPRAAAACRPAGLEAPASAPAPASRRRRHRRSSFAAGRHRRATSGASRNALRRPRSPEPEFRPCNGPRMRSSHGSDVLGDLKEQLLARQAEAHTDGGPVAGTGCQEEPLPGSSPLTSSRPGPAPREDQVWRTGLGGDPASSLPLGSSCLKYLTFLFNFLFSLLGLLALAVGLWGLAVKGSLGSSRGAALPEDPLLGLTLGGLVVSAVSLAGCLGALCENACLLHCFSGGLIAFLALEAVVGALLVAFWGPLQDGLEPTLRVAITHYQDDPDLRFLIDQVQLGLQCCGVSSYQDWTWNLYFNCSSPGVQACRLPASCCINPREDGAAVNPPCGFRALGLDEDAAQRRVHLQGCGPPLRGWLRRNVRAVGACTIVVVVVQGVELLLAAQLVRALAVRRVGGGEPQNRGDGKVPCQTGPGLTAL
ncbi:tetraspanin-10 [Mirounga angustirostris]|uniref:tetraspanin-10 n=1 Tax=Mirounga angustirostris TaxID=9716 RepID=UPI001E68E215|nr:tetraspanin-10 [Mirounga angustirostris]